MVPGQRGGETPPASVPRDWIAIARRMLTRFVYIVDEVCVLCLFFELLLSFPYFLSPSLSVLSLFPCVCSHCTHFVSLHPKGHAGARLDLAARTQLSYRPWTGRRGVPDNDDFGDVERINTAPAIVFVRCVAFLYFFVSFCSFSVLVPYV